FRGVADGFNSMAEELGNTEVLRSDFINNFSHEFKTPIVSIAGFCELLRSEDLTDEEREHYLGIIGEESRRLASLATNILNLTKIENQSILTDIRQFNLSEQIRSAVLLLESKWATRGIVPVIEFDEISIRANEQLLKEVWLNLLDNAIKFSPNCAEIGIFAEEADGFIRVRITNSGKEIPKEAIPKIFAKFYQADESHSTAGSGVGLAVVIKVVELHRGRVEVESDNGLTAFTVTLPCRANQSRIGT
ncbi:MAG: HAMP domain-containing histidine kinase, partial [Opitutales bacterium]|nr:HAMP domain-containing histidine kinase [Opitutales bacterium]